MASSGARRDADAAQVLIDDFVRQAQARGVAPEPLRATLNGGGTAKTGLEGWYVNAARTLAIGTDGAWYRLVAPGGLAARLRGVTIQPSPPSRSVMPGGRDGESGDLTDFLARRLAQG